ncbi:achaete-scute complex protein T4-like [Haliotis cracherodii]|uniref:achaete-scute complex protein T4-like n=1 Tax=Haliotis cracherodii TaxID=6455 RepID=UPI0039EC3C5B
MRPGNQMIEISTCELQRTNMAACSRLSTGTTVTPPRETQPGTAFRQGKDRPRARVDHPVRSVSKKGAPYRHVPHSQKPPHLVQRRNARERRRVQAVNGAFSRLRKHVPYEPKHKRLSKVKTLRVAIDYIRQLEDMITDHDRRARDARRDCGGHQVYVNSDIHNIVDGGRNWMQGQPQVHPGQPRRCAHLVHFPSSCAQVNVHTNGYLDLCGGSLM